MMTHLCVRILRIMNLFVLSFISLLLYVNVNAQGPAAYAELTHDVAVRTTVDVMTLTLNLDASTNVLVASDGRFFPLDSAIGMVQIMVDGESRSTRQTIDWAHSKLPSQHSFSLVGMVNLAPGTHVISLSVSTLNGAGLYVGAGSNLGVLPLDHSVNVAQAMLQSDSGPYKFSVPPGTNVMPHKPVVTVSLPASPSESGGYGRILALASGSSYVDGVEGDPVWLVYINGDDNVYNNQTLHADNDLYSYAEANNAPMMTYGFFDGLAEWSQTTISLDATSEPWEFCCNTVQYKIGAGTGIVALSGLPIMYRAVLSTAINSPIEYICVASNAGWTGCPVSGPPHSFAQVRFTVPQGHGGDVYLMAKALVQAYEKDEGGFVVFQIRLDGTFVGSVGVQELRSPDCISTRMISASYLATGLSAGSHYAEIVVTAQGSFLHLSFTRDLPMVVFG